MARLGSYGASVDLAWDETESVHKVALLVWNTNTLAWEKYSGAAGGTGGAGDASAANQTTEIAKLTSIDGKLGSLGQKTKAGSAPVVFASDQDALPVTAASVGSASLTSVAGANSSTSLLSANASRKGVLLFNDSTANAFVAYAGVASSSAFTVKMAPGGYWEMPSPIYTGAIFAFWDAANGAMRITEL